VQGLGFVGAANAVAIASAKNETGQRLYRVVGVDRDTTLGRCRVAALNEGRFPFATSDPALTEAASAANAAGNLIATTDAAAFSEADIVVVDVGLDIAGKGERPRFDMVPFRAAISAIGKQMRADALILLESTVPPGTCERIVAPLLREHLAARGLPCDGISLAYSYERVMPGDRYLASITHMWRVYAGVTPQAAAAAESFLATIVSPEYPLRRLENVRSAELAKIIENSFRAVNIAFVDEWERFGRRIGVDLFEVLEAIRVRPTHQNIRYPGVGVGGYCLSKDPLFGVAAARDIFGFDDLEFPLSVRSVSINDSMPSVSANILEEMAGGSLAKRKILVLGASYRPDVGDTRNSPSLQLVAALLHRGAIVAVVDPLADELPDSLVPLHRTMPPANDWDVIVLAVAHRQFVDLDIGRWAGHSRPLVFDANGVLTKRALEVLKQSGFPVAAIGRGSI
jgi:nucleotide sugar dehydrogenase